MSEWISQEENFSDDSLEVCFKPMTKVKKLRKRPEGKLTYLQLYQRRLISEFFSAKEFKHENLNHTTRASSPCDDVKDRCVNNVEKRVEKNQLPKLQKAPLNVWSEFLSKKYKLAQTKSDVEVKFEMLKKRLEYGKQMSSLNRFNKMCIKQLNETSERALTNKVVPQIVDKAAIDSHTKPSIRLFKKASKSKAKKEEIEEIQLKIKQLKIRHKKDKQIAEKIRISLKYVCELADE